MDVKEFIIKNWKNAETLKTLLGFEFDRNDEFDFDSILTEQGQILVVDEFDFGSVPAKQARIEVSDGKISRITTWSGLSWKARYAYNSVVDVKLYD
jgi:hypothetical protein